MGIGYQLVRALPPPWRRALRARWILLGTLLPDLVDKTLYFGSVLALGRVRTENGLLTGSRTIGHTLVATLAMAAAGRLGRKSALLAISAGMLTHLALDCASKIAGQSGSAEIFVSSIVLWPAGGWRFPQTFDGYTVDFLENPTVLLVEGLGAVLLARAALQAWRRTEAAR